MTASFVAGVISLLQAASVSPSLGGISPPPLPSNAAYPYLTVRQMADDELESMTGASGLCETFIEVSHWAADYETAFQARQQTKALLLPYKGATLDLTIASVNHQGGFDLFVGDQEVHQLIARFRIWWEA